jgi:hypothetical protein
VVAVAVLQRAGLALPAVLAVALEVRDSVHAGAVVAARVGVAIVRICKYEK